MSTRKHFSLIWFLFVILFSYAKCADADEHSVFAIAGHSNGKVKAYLVNPDGTIEYQTTIPHPLPDATGLCLWPEKDRMFVTYEGVGTISWASIKNLSRDPEEDNYDTGITSGNGLGGMAINESYGILYVLNRGTNRLYGFSYNEYTNLLSPEPLGSATDYVLLENVSSGMDIALDETGSLLFNSFSVGRLYASDMNSSLVRYYNTATWEHEGSIEFDHPVVGIGLDKTRGYLYGGYFSGGSGQNYLMRATLDNDPNLYVETEIGYPVMDIAVDEETGYLYLTTYRTYNGRTGAVEVYNPTNWNSSDPNSLLLLQIINDSDFGGGNNGPAGIAIGPRYKPPHDLYLDKIDDVEDPDGCVVPSNYVTYTIAFHPGPYDEPNVVIADMLPDGVNFISANPDDPNWCYYTERPVHTYTWELGDVMGWDPNSEGDPNYYFELIVQVNNYAEPMGTLYNKVSAESDWAYTDAEEITSVCCWGPNVIYVDRYAPGPHIGTSWHTAYTKLQDALGRAAKDCRNVIWVADGTYQPGSDSSNDFFDVPAGVSVYGGYAGYGATDPNERNWRKYKTVLSGYIDEDTRNNKVVVMGNNSLLDGVTVKEGNLYGIFSSGASYSVTNCIVMNIQERGIYCLNGDLTIRWVEIKENGEQGIYHDGSSYSLLAENCKIFDNQWDGILTWLSTSTILNSLIYQNGSDGNYYGINLVNPSSNSEIRNNTIAYNVNEGIRYVGTTQNHPDVWNNILWYNNLDDNGEQMSGIGARFYNCIYDPNNPEGSSQADGNGNITADPNFAYNYPVYGYFHLKWSSPCKDKGDTNAVETGEVDMDNLDRIEDDEVDMGADEIACEDTFDPNDWNGDGVINYGEFLFLSRAWLSRDPNDPAIITDPNYSEDPDYADPETLARWEQAWFPWGKTSDMNHDLNVDLSDLELFMDNWLWKACWWENYIAVYGTMSGNGESMMMAMPMKESLMAASVQMAYEPSPAEEKSNEQQILDLEEAIEFLEKIWMEDPYIQQEIDPEDWKEFMEAVYNSLYEMKT